MNIGKEGRQQWMDMWRARIKAAVEHLPNADIVHECFHVSKHLNESIDKVRRQENKAMSKEKDRTLKNNKYTWLTGFENLTEEMEVRFNELQSLGLKVERAYAIKETFYNSCNYR